MNAGLGDDNKGRTFVMSAITHLTQYARRRLLPPIYDEATHWYQGWYFDLRLEEELARGKRYGIAVAVLVVLLPGPFNRQQAKDLNARLPDIAAKALRRSDIPALLEENEYAIALPHTSPQQAETVVRRLVKSFSGFAPIIGVAGFPDDSDDSAQLLLIAEHRAMSAALAAGTPADAIRRRGKTHRD